MKQTAIEWLIKEHFGDIENCSPNFRNKIQQAKEIEKQQIMDAFIKGFNRDYFSSDFQDQKEFAEQYYNETFKNK